MKYDTQLMTFRIFSKLCFAHLIITIVILSIKRNITGEGHFDVMPIAARLPKYFTGIIHNCGYWDGIDK